MNDTNKKKILEFCGWTLRNKAEDSEANKYGFVMINAWCNPEGKISELPELTTDWLFHNFIPAWNKANPENELASITFGHYTDGPNSTKYCELKTWTFPLSTEQGATEAEAFAEAALKLLETD